MTIIKYKLYHPRFMSISKTNACPKKLQTHLFQMCCKRCGIMPLNCAVMQLEFVTSNQQLNTIMKIKMLVIFQSAVHNITSLCLLFHQCSSQLLSKISIWCFHQTRDKADYMICIQHGWCKACKFTNYLPIHWLSSQIGQCSLKISAQPTTDI